MRNTSRRHGRLIWWACGGLLFVFVGLVGYQIYVRGERFVADKELLAALGEQKLHDADVSPREPTSWPQWRGQRRDGVATAPDLLTEWPADGPPQLWRVKGGFGYSSFAVADGRVVCMLGRDGKQEVIAWDVKDGTELWARECGESNPNDHGGNDFGGPRATPAIDGGRVYAFSSRGVLLCLDASTGAPKWQADLVQELGARMPKWAFASSPLIEGGLVYVMPGGDRGRSLAAFDKLTGKLAWSALDDVAGYSSPVAATIGGVRQVICLTGKRLVGVTAAKGELLWSFDWADRFEVNAATPVLVRSQEGDYVFISCGYGKGCALVKVEQEGGGFTAKEVYEGNELCCHFASPVLHGDYLYALDETRDLTCLDVKTGQVKWRKRGFQKGSLLRVDGRLIVLGERGNLALVECDPERYREVARSKPLAGKCWTMPALADGRLYLRDQSEVVCLDVRAK